MNYEEALEYIDSFTNYEKTTSWDYPKAFNLDRMRTLAKEFGNPQKAYECVLIAGSKGKGSTAAILSSILRMENLRVGLYTSPHLADLRERIQVNGLPVGETRFVEMVLKLRRILDSVSWRRNPPTYFEVLTAIAFYHFKEMKIHVAVLEVGLGGLFDSTNIAEAQVVGITPISLEHTDKLGKTLSKIAVQKCGIIKGREWVVSGVQEEEAESVIQKAAEEREGQLVRVGREIKIFERDFGGSFQRFDMKSTLGNYYGLELQLLGRHQIENAGQAIGLAKGLEKKCRFKISEAAVRQGVLDARWPGRLEKVEDCPTVVLDGAQNPVSVKKALEGVRRHFEFERLVVVLGISSDKDLVGILKELSLGIFCLVATQSKNPRAMDAAVIAEAAKDLGLRVFQEECSWEALEKAKAVAGRGDLILVTGSLFLVGDIRRRLKENGN